MNDLCAKLDPDGTWPCPHTDRDGRPAPPTRLRLDETSPFDPRLPSASGRRRIRCRDCGTRWRVWTQLGVAKPSTDRDSSEGTAPYRYRPAPVRDIDRVIEAVARELPDVSVTQHWDAWPADDEGVWFFRLPHVEGTIQLESSTGTCPFVVEHDGMDGVTDPLTVATVDEAARRLVDYLRTASRLEKPTK